MQDDRFTIKAVEAVQRAEHEARDRGQAEIMPLHLLFALVVRGVNGVVIVPMLLVSVGPSPSVPDALRRSGGRHPPPTRLRATASRE